MRELIKDKNLVLQSSATFFLTSAIQLIWVALPFVIKAMKASDTAVGFCFMGQMAVYVVFCVVAGLVTDNLNPRKVLLVGSTAAVFVICGFFLTVKYGLSGTFFGFNSVLVLTVLMGFGGIITAFFWPVMMGWISTGYEGATLSKRFGFYNITWGTANMVLPIVGGYLVEINYTLPAAVAVVLTILCWLSVVAGKYEGKKPKQVLQDDEVVVEGVEYNKEAFIWMARVALFSTFACVGLFRSQAGILYKFELGFAESLFGWAIAIMCLSNVLVFYIMGRSHWWHYKKMPFVVSQITLLLSMVLIFAVKNLTLQLSAAFLSGIAYGFVYSSHQYYGVSGGKKRFRLMAIHEIAIGLGMSSGAFFGGVLSDLFGRSSPYECASVLVIVAALVQVVLWFALRKKTAKVAGETSCA